MWYLCPPFWNCGNSRIRPSRTGFIYIFFPKGKQGTFEIPETQHRGRKLIQFLLPPPTLKGNDFAKKAAGRGYFWFSFPRATLLAWRERWSFLGETLPLCSSSHKIWTTRFPAEGRPGLKSAGRCLYLIQCWSLFPIYQSRFSAGLRAAFTMRRGRLIAPNSTTERKCNQGCEVFCFFKKKLLPVLWFFTHINGERVEGKARSREPPGSREHFFSSSLNLKKGA